MPIQVSVPRLGWSMDEGTLVEWFKREGEFVQKGDMLFSLEGDKATQEVESFDEGYLRMLPDSPQAGDAVKVGQVLAVLLAEGESITAIELADETSITADAPPTASVISKAEVPAGSPSVQLVARSSVKASPRARRAAARFAVDWQKIPGTGRNGRIRERDVLAAASALSAHSSSHAAAMGTMRGRRLPITPLRRMIATRMTEAIHHAAPVTLTTQADASELVARREQWRSTLADARTGLPSYTDMIVKIVGTILAGNLEMQAQWQDEGLFIPSEVNICLAVDTEAGLTVPVLRDVPSISLKQIGQQTRELAEAARGRRLAADQVQGGTFTVTNLGGFGIDGFTPILHLPQSTILGIGRIVLEPAVVNGQIEPRHRMWLSLTFDHRVHDGAPAARFLATIRQAIEAAEIKDP